MGLAKEPAGKGVPNKLMRVVGIGRRMRIGGQIRRDGIRRWLGQLPICAPIRRVEQFDSANRSAIGIKKRIGNGA